MKLKGLTKLALSGVALAAVAATLGTSTYAWYVSNDKATVTGMNGTSADSQSGNLMVAKLTPGTGGVLAAGNWGGKITDITATQSPQLNPVTKDTTGEGGIAPGTGATGWHDKKNEPVATASAYGEYIFGIWSTDKEAALMKVGIKNSTETFKYQTCYNTAGTSTSTASTIGVDDSFTSDFVNALRFEIFQGVLTSSSTVATIAVAGNSLGVFEASSFLKDDLSGTYVIANPGTGKKIIAGGDAHAYYKAVSGETSIPGGETEVAGTKVGQKELDLAKASGESQKYVLVFRYWLEGTDKDCFDSCNGQKFDLNLEFTAQNPSNAG